MITYVVCDLFTSPARTLVNTVNTVGVMGKGIAKDFKTIYPEMFARYQELCERKQFDINCGFSKWVLNFAAILPILIEAGLQIHGIRQFLSPSRGVRLGYAH